ncbi:helix-turn-helix domain-containing protein [[Clostridium] leptum]|nr:helix-turn-helix domain-containing protein [[Clostridium] leptum]
MFYDRFKEICTNHNVSMSSVLDKAGLSRGNLARWKSGIEPKYDTQKKIANALNISIYDLIEGGFGALDPVLPPNMLGARLDSAKIDKYFLNSMLSKLSFLDRESIEYRRSKDNILALADNSDLGYYARRILHKIENSDPAGLYFLTLNNDESEIRDKLIYIFDQLNAKGQQIAVERVEELTKIPDYQKADEEE